MKIFSSLFPNTEVLEKSMAEKIKDTIDIKDEIKAIENIERKVYSLEMTVVDFRSCHLLSLRRKDKS